jgi:RimJ/RimL family protein N-acetyltransferase
MLRKDLHGQGIGRAALTYALNAAFAEPECQCLSATTWIDNAASHHLLTSVGFAHYRTQYERSKARRLPVLSRHYRLIRADWDRLRTAAQ